MEKGLLFLLIIYLFLQNETNMTDDVATAGSAAVRSVVKTTNQQLQMALQVWVRRIELALNEPEGSSSRLEKILEFWSSLHTTSLHITSHHFTSHHFTCYAF